MKTNTRRVYELASVPDTTNVLVDRLWPRGVSKEKLGDVKWLKDAAPSHGLRKWFHQSKEKRWEEFNRRFLAELRSRRASLKEQLKPFGRKVTLLTGVKDVERSHIPALEGFLKRF